MKYEVVLFDFDGVLCHDRFYTRLYERYPEAREFVESQVFGRGSDLSDRWMRGELSSEVINCLIAERTDVGAGEVKRRFDQGMSEMRVDERMIAAARSLAADGVAVGLVTCNMDVFSEITVPQLALDTVFSAIVNSCDYGCLKHDAGGRLFDIALARLGQAGGFAEALLIDDSATSRVAFRKKGGDSFPYRRFDICARWADVHLAVKPDIGNQRRSFEDQVALIRPDHRRGYVSTTAQNQLDPNG